MQVTTPELYDENLSFCDFIRFERKGNPNKLYDKYKSNKWNNGNQRKNHKLGISWLKTQTFIFPYCIVELIRGIGISC